jgi:hypothetical protein
VGGSHIAPGRAQGDFDLSGKIVQHVLQRMTAQICQNVKDTVVAYGFLPAAGRAFGTVTPLKNSIILPCGNPAFCKSARQGLSRPARGHLNRSGLERGLSAHTSRGGTRAKRRAWDGCHDICGRVPVRKHPV